MDRDEAVKMIAGIHKDTYDTVTDNKLILQSLDEKADNFEVKMNDISEKLNANFKNLREEIEKTHTDINETQGQNYLTLLNEFNKKIQVLENNDKLLADGMTASLKEIRSTKRKVFETAKNVEAIKSDSEHTSLLLKVLFVFVVIGTMATCLFLNYKLNIFNKLEDLIKGQRNIVPYSSQIATDEITNFTDSENVYEWSELTISSLNELIEDMSICRDKFGDDCIFKFVTNDTTDIDFLGHDIQVSRIKEVWDDSIEHHIKKKVEKVPVNCYADNNITLKKGSYFITYMDIN